MFFSGPAGCQSRHKEVVVAVEVPSADGDLPHGRPILPGLLKVSVEHDHLPVLPQGQAEVIQPVHLQEASLHRPAVAVQGPVGVQEDVIFLSD